ncbi:hypothetical protein [Wolbachia endosymbiont (group A) of Eupithecia tripunctaria]|nr:hypothetical protein [Wolbachia endosymbiont (group A) of Eupithecia tripunctaria]
MSSTGMTGEGTGMTGEGTGMTGEGGYLHDTEGATALLDGNQCQLLS